MRSANLIMESNGKPFFVLGCWLCSGQMKQNIIQYDDLFAKQINSAIQKGHFKYLIFSYVLKRFCYLKLLDDVTQKRVHQTNFRWKNCKRQSL